MFKIVWELRGEHVHATLFTMPRGVRGTWANAGNLCLRQTEWRDFCDQVAVGSIEFENKPQLHAKTDNDEWPG